MDILVVDDERLFLEGFREWARLADEKMNVITADSAKMALEMLRTANVDVVMTDLRMPDMDGHELLKIVIERYARIPVIVMTAGASPETERRLRDSGAALCLDKPLDFGTIMQTVRDVRSTAHDRKHVAVRNGKPEHHSRSERHGVSISDREIL